MVRLKHDKKSLYKAVSQDAIWKASFQACKGGLGFIQSELQERSKKGCAEAPDFHLLLLIVTSAPLWISDMPIAGVDLATGRHLGPLRLRQVPWLHLHHPFTPSYQFGTSHLEISLPHYSEPYSRGLNGKEGILIVNSARISDFIDYLRSRTNDLKLIQPNPA